MKDYRRHLRNGVPAGGSLEERFWQRIERPSDPGACHEWTGATTRGYGCIRINRRTTPTHRLAWTLSRGPIPEGLWVLHRCDNRLCCNADHLFLGDVRANVSDMVAKGRNRPCRKEGHPRAKLNEQCVKVLRAMRGRKTSILLAALHGVGASTVTNVWTGQTWRDAGHYRQIGGSA